jgi:phosphomannomutase / phosphoglucomutase
LINDSYLLYTLKKGAQSVFQYPRSTVKKNIFREYDIRGIVGSELNIDESYNLGRAIVSYLKTLNPTMKSIIVGRDGRSHSIPLTEGITQAILDTGIDVIDIGLSPTPAMYFAIHRLNNPYGLAITASHNPKEYNGVKIWGAWGEHIQEIQKLYETKNFLPKTAINGMHTHVNIVDDYITYLENAFSHLRGKSINAVVDCGNGSAGIVFPQLVKALSLKNITILFADVDGNFPNHEADPTVPENMTFVKEALNANPEFTFGIGFDGDCDRMNPMTKNGTLVPGDQLLALFAEQALQTHPGKAVVFDIKSSGGLVELLQGWNAQPIMSPSGHTYIKQNMKKYDAVLGGELSCHFFFADRYFGYDDGIYAALRLFEIIAMTGKSLETLLEVFPYKMSSPEIRIACKSDDEKKVIIDHVKGVFAARTDVESITVDGIRAVMPYGWGLARASNTQPVICLRFEAANSNNLNHIKQDFFDALTPYFDPVALKERIELE